MITEEVIKFASLYLIGIITPGPSVALVIKNGIIFSRRLNSWTLLGVIAGIIMQSSMVMLGLNAIVNNKLLYNGMRIVCAGYMIYLGTKDIFKKNSFYCASNHTDDQKYYKYTKLKLFQEGFFIEILNPIALTFFFTLFSMFTKTYTSIYTCANYIFLVIIFAIIWFSLVNMVSTTFFLSSYIKKHSQLFNNCFGLYLIILSMNLVYQLIMD